MTHDELALFMILRNSCTPVCQYKPVAPCNTADQARLPAKECLFTTKVTCLMSVYAASWCIKRLTSWEVGQVQDTSSHPDLPRHLSATDVAA